MALPRLLESDARVGRGGVTALAHARVDLLATRRLLGAVHARERRLLRCGRLGRSSDCSRDEQCDTRECHPGDIDVPHSALTSPTTTRPARRLTPPESAQPSPTTISNSMSARSTPIANVASSSGH